MDSQKMALTAIDGSTWFWPDLARSGKYTVCVFTSVQCPYALAYFGTIDRIASRYSSDGINFLLISSNESTEEDPEDLEAMRVLSPSPSVPFLRDEDGLLAQLFNATHTPHCFVVDPECQVKWSGPVDSRFRSPDQWTEGAEGPWPWDEETLPEPSRTQLEDVIESLLRSVAITSTIEKPIGCTIKRNIIR